MLAGVDSGTEVRIGIVGDGVSEGSMGVIFGDPGACSGLGDSVGMGVEIGAPAGPEHAAVKENAKIIRPIALFIFISTGKRLIGRLSGA